MLDLKILGGVVVDGLGSPPRPADVGVRDGRIVELGELRGAAAEVTIDAEGALVTPGFIDLHTHYDGQVSWDADLAPSSLHGVTTAVMGSCGVGFAPARAADRQRLIELMEGVEDIPGSALSEGLRWGWESFPEYLDALDAMPHAIDFAAQVTHDPLRVFVMGERGLAREEATDADLAAMQGLLREALGAGAVGFSTGRTDNHRSATGADTPASIAGARELVALAGAFAGLGHGVLQAVSDFDMAAGPDRFDAEFDLLEAMAAAAPGHPLSVSLMQRDADPEQWKRILARVERTPDLRVQVAPRAIGVLLGLSCTFHPFMGKPSYKAISALPLPERVRRMREPELRARILAEPSDPVAGDGSPIPPLADRLLAAIDRLAFRLFRLGATPAYEPPVTASIGARAQAAGLPPVAALYDALLEGDGHELLYFPLFNYAGFDLEAVRTMMEHPRALPGLSDGGAHVGTICDASFPTFYLTHWARDRAAGRWPVERAVKFLTGDVARFLGLHDRGVVAVGRKADLNVIDHARLRLHRPRLVADLPAGGRRLLQDADGYRATLVSGAVIARDGALTGARPGRLVRAGPLTALLAIVLVAFTVEATAGFGATVLTVTLAAFLYPVEEVLAALVPVNLLLSAWIVARHAGDVDRTLLFRRVLPTMGAGMALGLALFHLRGEGWIKGAFGLFVAALSAMELARGTAPPASPRARTAALLAAGLVHGLFACGGPLLVWVIGRELPDKGRFRATLSAVWLVLGGVLLANYAAAGTLTRATLPRSAALLLPLAAALWLGERVHHRIDPAAFRRVVFALLLVAGLSLAGRASLG